MERSTDVTREVVLIIQAVIILLVTAERLLPAFQAWRVRRALEAEGEAQP
jgi:simple sugar transport system permease protein